MRFALTIFLSAFLLFQVQPLMGRYILPWFGGTPAVWTTCMLLFQMLLLCGYAYAHGIASRFTPRVQGSIHLVLLLVALAFLPVVPRDSWKPSGEETPAWLILGLLAATVGMPYLLISSTGPLLQSWFSRTYPGRSPYRLYALSNVGSLLALVSYPIAFEPWFPLKWQAWGWSIGFVLFVLCCGWTAFRFRQLGDQHVGDGQTLEPVGGDDPTATPASMTINPETSAPGAVTDPAPAWHDLLFWLGASACGSMLLLATTNQMCQEIAAGPFLWVMPLALYLITFIISFDHEKWYHRAVFGPLWCLSAAWAVHILLGGPKVAIWQQVGGLALAIFAGCMVCHGELVRSRPSVRHLTLYFLTISAGGALGGLFVALVAPVIFTGFWEIHVALELTSMLMLWAWFRDPKSLIYRGSPWWAWMPLASLLIVQQAFLSKNIYESNEDVIDRSRNFFGVMRVKEYPVTAGEEVVMLRSLIHGNILHGVQMVDEPWCRQPTTYYGHDSGVGVATLNHPKRSQQPYPGMHLGVIGLGAGTLATYGGELDRVTFYEINPEVVRLNELHFTYLKNLPHPPQMILGDARIRMERQLQEKQPQNFDVLAVDAFSSDAIPMHLLTLESFKIYRDHLAPGGILCIHVSNNHLNLVPVVRGLADALQLKAGLVHGREEDAEQLSSNNWIVLTNNEDFWKDDKVQMHMNEWDSDDPPPLVWTDDYGALFQILKWK